MTREADRCFPLETGGVLAGYRAGPTQVVTHIVGPGPKSQHTRVSFEGDHDWQCEQLEDLYETSGRITVYLGDWHTHPLSTPHISAMDRRTLARIANHKEANCSEPLMIIAGGTPKVWAWQAYTWRRTSAPRLQRLRIKRYPGT